jgi:hypothetical protein
MSIARVTSLAAIIVLCMASQRARAQVTQPDLRKFTEGLLRRKVVSYEPPKFDWSQRMMRYNLGHVDFNTHMWFPDREVLQEHGLVERLEPAIDEQFGVTLLRTHRMDNPRQQEFWTPVLERVESKIAKMIDIAQQENGASKRSQRLMNDLITQIRSIYQEELDALAKREGYEGAKPEAPKAMETLVDLSTDPPGGTVQIMAPGPWELYEFLRKKGRTDVVKPEWVTIAQLKKVPLYGMNWFRVTWPDGRWTVQLIDVKSGDAIVFTPGAKLDEHYPQ